ncbi:MAG TPA: SUMF1/EgtB/PvdO family nonheme iron enzyme [Syntrophobacteraceae bacterium]|nr:SUMF1/EgtB/PvdO family nonheme iron enzyme [Syntrophobacteraceae bacterium]
MNRVVGMIGLLAFCALSWAPNPAWGMEKTGRPPSSPAAVPGGEQRTALVIGNGSYETSPLRNPVNDARAIARALAEVGFEVSERENLSQKDMKREIQAFGQKLQKGGVGLFYYAGHGMQVDGKNYLIPIGAKIEHEKHVEYEGVDVGSVLSEMEYARNRLNIVILDACRDNPFARSFRSGAQGLASVNAPIGTIIAYATAPGSVANDGPEDHGVYTGELIRVMKAPGVKIEDVFKQVRSAVREGTQGRQVPWESSSLEGDFFFMPGSVAAAPVSVAENKPTVVASSTSRGEASPKAVKSWKEPVSGMEFLWIPGGCFNMGSPETEAGRDADEGPVHEVCLEGFWMAKTETTNGQFRKFQPNHDSRDYDGFSLNGDNQPAVHVTWEDANGFAQWLKAQNGGKYKFRLPTEAEWEYACRAGSDAARYWGDDPNRACTFENVADHTARNQWGWEESHDCDDGYAATSPVAAFQPNAFGLYDMLGNVWEWCEDTYGIDVYTRHDRNGPVYVNAGVGADRVIRGGYWHGSPRSVRCADRGSGLPNGMNDDLGFRLVREP